ncbi:MAG TPA: hypothetical protein PLU87_17930 [Sedimentisphaerales bacterium]|nr:hypothetical protein [Sedimentisphaerales bacterium]HRS12894.1 hypothetical protein [Sedimentisphaerales bacterium]HRV49504.1 hypothetical protein [Sedimentisphaerales bacterium]
MLAYVIDNPAASEVRVKTDMAFPMVLGVLFFVVYTQGYIERIGVSSAVVKILVETPVFLILMHLINRGVSRWAPGLLWIVMYAIWTMVSAIYNGDSMFVALLYCRYVIYGYVVFAATWSTPLTKTAVTHLNTTIALLFLLQIAASAHEVFVRGERVEAHVGALYADGGAMATEFPLLAMALVVPLYLYYRENPGILVLAWIFFLVGYASGKRAIYLFGPSLYFLILGWHVVEARTWPALRRLLRGSVVFLGLAPLLLFGVTQSKGISLSGPGGIVERTVYAWQRAREYNSREDRSGQTEGRMATSQRVLVSLLQGNEATALFGWGPSAVMGRGGRFDTLRIAYGITGWTRDAISIGLPGMALYLLFHVCLFQWLRRAGFRARSGYWPALYFGTKAAFGVLLMCHLCYSSSLPTCGQLSYVYFYLVALLASPNHTHLVG